MKKPIILLLAIVAGAALAGIAVAASKKYQMPDENAVFLPGPGSDIAQNNCVSCHSTDYVNFQPSKKGQAFWDAEVQKMIKVYHAPISEGDARTIADYLAKTY